MIKRLPGIIGLLLALLLVVLPASGQENTTSPITITQNETRVHYPDGVDFRLAAESDVGQITSVRLFWRAGVADAFTIQPLRPGQAAGGGVSARWQLRTPTFDLPALPPFARISYRWEVQDAAGNRFVTETAQVEFTDDSHDWQEIGTGNVRLLWYGLDTAYAGELLAVADAAYLRLAQYFGVAPDERPIILIYSDQPSFIESQGFMANVDSVIGRYYPGHNITANLYRHDAEANELLATIAHELSHLFSDSYYGGYAMLPMWLEEGLARFNEQRGEIDELAATRQAGQHDQLIPFINLDSAIRAPDTRIAVRAYNQSATVYHFIADRWGLDYLPRFLDRFHHTTDFNRVTSDIFGLNMAEFELAWRAWIGFPTDTVPMLPTPFPTFDPFTIPTAQPVWTPNPS